MDVTTTATRIGKFDARFFHLVFEEEIGRVKGHFGPINSVTFHPDGKRYNTVKKMIQRYCIVYGQISIRGEVKAVVTGYFQSNEKWAFRWRMILYSRQHSVNSHISLAKWSS